MDVIVKVGQFAPISQFGAGIINSVICHGLLPRALTFVQLRKHLLGLVEQIDSLLEIFALVGLSLRYDFVN